MLQRGSFLLEALIAVLIVALAILGIVGLMAWSIQNVDDSKYRGEAAALGTNFIGNMWLDDRTTAALQAKYVSPGTGYTELQSLMTQRLPNAQPPVVNIVAGTMPETSDITVTMQWQPPGDTVLHSYQVFATVGANN
jgi:Tfp pilus assembly protein PilV